MSPLEISVVIPAYNEAAVIGQTVKQVAHYLHEQHLMYEVLVVDDGSMDETVKQVHEMLASLPSLRLIEASHRGKGAAVKQGVLAAQGRYVLVMDADLSTPIHEWQRCVPWLQNGHEVVIGSRKMAGATVLKRQPPLREAMGKVFTWLTNRLLGTRVTDITCGFKGFHREAAQRIFRLQRMEGWAFDAEILFLARRLGYRMKEVPVRWVNDESTKVRLVMDACRSLKELLAIRVGAWKGWYLV
jgi:dolichyl-phosphate beta-glucosyltransferase